MRRASAMAALVASIVYAMLATWHGVFMPSGSAAGISPEAALELSLKSAICHAAAIDQANAVDSEPAPADRPVHSGCPVCKGLAGCQLFALVAAQAGLLAPPASAGVLLAWTDEEATDRASITPRSRGPPLRA